MRPRPITALRILAPLAALALVAGCVSERGGSASGGGSAAAPARLPGVFGARWAAPDFATRVVDAPRAATFDACVAAANDLGYAVNRTDGAMGKVSGARRQSTEFDGARQATLEISVTTLDPGNTKVAVTLREAFESGSGDERSPAMVTTSLVRDRAPYDAFFARLAAALAPAAAATTTTAPAH